ncbi:TetR/AcrR family transcriptional regulator [Mycobacterium sp. OTB74]|uniref:TetR/AcrR family transcriptional regulator n=1 Tax=Mycobacterium sp. OTB74 TaxID=1853452 RepID=UPI0032AF8EC6
MADRHRARRAELVREEVIDAALAEFAIRGYHQTSISHIAKRLGAGHSMFYRYFANKRDIIEQAVCRVNGRLLTAIGEAKPGSLSSIAEFREYVLAVGMAYTDVLAEEPRLLQLIVVEAAGVDQQMTEEFHRMFDGGVRALSAMLRDGIDHAYLRSDIDVHGTAESIVAIPFGIALRHGQKPERESLVTQTRATTDLVVRGIAAEWLPEDSSGPTR